MRKKTEGRGHQFVQGLHEADANDALSEACSAGYPDPRPDDFVRDPLLSEVEQRKRYAAYEATEARERAADRFVRAYKALPDGKRP